MMCQKSSNSTIHINKSPMDFESRCQKVIPTYLRIRMGRRSSFTSHTWSNTITTTIDSTLSSTSSSSSLTTKRNSKISMENSWKSQHCPNAATRMNCDWSLKWQQHRSEPHVEQSTLDHQRMNQLTINHCHHHSNDSKLKHQTKESTKNSHSIHTMMPMIGGQKSQSHMKYKFSDLHRTHKRMHSTSKLINTCI